MTHTKPNRTTTSPSQATAASHTAVASQATAASQAVARSQVDIVIRRATEEDIPAIQDIARNTWGDTYRDIIPPEAQKKILVRAYSRQSLTSSIGRGQAFLVAEERSQPTAVTEEHSRQAAVVEERGQPTAVAEERSQPAGAAEEHAQLAGYVDVDFDGTQFNLHRLYVLPSSQRSGLGRTLLSAALRALVPDFVPPNERWNAATDTQSTPIAASRGFAGSSTERSAGAAAPVLSVALAPIPAGDYRLVAHVERDNPKARAFYGKMGFHEDKEENVTIGGITLPLIRISVKVSTEA